MSPEKKQKAKAAKERREKLNREFPYGSMAGSGEVIIIIQERDKYWMKVKFIEKNQKPREYLIRIGDDIQRLGQFIHALAARYNFHVARQNEEAEAATLTRAVKIPYDPYIEQEEEANRECDQEEEREERGIT